MTDSIPPPLSFFHGLQSFFQEGGIAFVGFEEDVEEVASEGNGADSKVDKLVGDEVEQRSFSEFIFVGEVEVVNQWDDAHEISYHGNEAYETVPSKTNLGAGDRVGRIHQSGHLVDFGEGGF